MERDYIYIDIRHYFSSSVYFVASDTRKNQPLLGLNTSTRSDHRSFRGLDKHANAVSKILSSSPDAKKEDAGLFKAQVYNANKTLLNEINNRLAYLFDFHDKALNAKEKKLALAIIDVISQIISKYLEIEADHPLPFLPFQQGYYLHFKVIRSHF